MTEKTRRAKLSKFGWFMAVVAIMALPWVVGFVWGRREMIETVELGYQIFWLVLALGGVAFALAIIWSLYMNQKEEGEE